MGCSCYAATLMVLGEVLGEGSHSRAECCPTAAVRDQWLVARRGTGCFERVSL